MAAHLAECGECDLLYREISARAERVATALGALADGIAPAREIPARRGRVAAMGGGGRDGGGAGDPAGQSEGEAARAGGAGAREGRVRALDNEPIDAGLVVRVSLGPDNVQADVIITADGRARAYRLVNNQ